MKKKLKNVIDINKIKDQLTKISPRLSNIKVEVKKDDLGNFHSQIRAHLPPKHEVFAAKSDNSLGHCMHKATHAMIKQIKKIKRPIKKQKLNLDFMGESTQ